MKATDTAVVCAIIIAGGMLGSVLSGCVGGAPQATNVAPPVETVAAPADTTPASQGSGPQEAAAGMTLRDLRASPKAGIHTVDVWVVQLKPCPECPPTLSCKPCLGDFVMIADAASPGEGADAKLGVLVPASGMGAFQVGKRYRLEIDVNQGSPDATTIVQARLVRVVTAL